MSDTIISANASIFRHRAFAILWTARILTRLAVAIQSVAIGWQVYSVARTTRSIEESAFLVGMVGLVQFLPYLAATLFAGDAADRHDRRTILLCSFAVQLFCSLGLAIVAFSVDTSLLLIFVIAAVMGATRAFMLPAYNSLFPMLIPRTLIPKMVAWNSLNNQMGMIFGTWLGGILCVYSPIWAYVTAAVMFAIAGLFLLFIKGVASPKVAIGNRLQMIREGFVYVWSNRLLFGAVSLDMFAVLLGGVTALLPIYARDILHVDAGGFGLLRSTEAVGGLVMAIILSQFHIRGRAGVFMFVGMAVFGVAAIVFALSTTMWLSMLALAIMGAGTTASYFVRQNIMQLTTPNHLLGRVSSISGLFIIGAKELGDFESGIAASILGPIGAAIFGGSGSIFVAGLWARLFPELRKAEISTEHSEKM